MTMATAEIVPSALDSRRKATEMEMKKAADYARSQAAMAAEKKALLDKLEKPSGVTEAERMELAASIIKRAVSNGLSEVEVGRFPNDLCIDHGRAINQQEPGWENTLTGLPKELYQFWKIHLQPLGYKVKFQIADWPNGMPGDISMTLSWDG